MAERNWRSRLNNCNLNHLIVLEAIIAERHVSHAAARLGMSQPAVSRVLKNLREILGDPILATGPGGAKLTPRAREIEPVLNNWLQGAAQIIGTKARNPKEFDGEIRISTLDDCQILFLNAIRQMLLKEAPGLRPRFVSQWGSKFESLVDGKIDVLIDIIPDVGIRFPFQPLIACEWICVMRASHPAVKAPLTLASYLSLDHALVTTTDVGPALVDQAIPEGNPPRRIVLRLPYFAPLPDVIDDSDIVTTMPIHIARKLFVQRNVIFLPVPVTLGNYSYSLIWHERKKRDPVHRFAVEKIVEACRNADIPLHASEL